MLRSLRVWRAPPPRKAAALRILNYSTGKTPFTVTFITPENEAVECRGSLDESVLDIAHANNIDLEGESQTW